MKLTKLKHLGRRIAIFWAGYNPITDRDLEHIANLAFLSSQGNPQAPPPYPQGTTQNANPAKRFKAGEEVVAQRPPQYLSQQQIQLLHQLQQNAANLNPQQQQMLVQLKQQYNLMVQHQRMVQAQQQQQQGPQGQQQQRPTNFTGGFQPDGQRTPTSGTAAQTGFVQDGNFSPATGHTQQAAGMPYKSAASGYPQGPFGGTQEFTQISSTTANQSDLGEYSCSVTL